MAKITQIKTQALAMPKKKRVAAYARVSLDSERLLHSLSNQVSYYSSLIQKNPEWEYAGVFADEGITGTLISKRGEFQRMIKECEEGKIDIILTKSIQRFARNTVDLLETVRHLKEIGVEVRFEKENINSMSGDGELMLTILASFAQEEMQSLSDNIKWAKRKKMEKGEPTARWRITGYRWEGDTPVIEPEGAAVVRRIFEEYLAGKKLNRIAEGLRADGYKTINGKPYCYTTVCRILRNVFYKGDLLLQKYYVEDPIGKVLKKNEGVLPQVYVEGHHAAIIEPEIFNKVQEELARRREEWENAEHDFKGMRVFSRLVKCGVSGAVMHHSNYGVGYGGDGAWGCHRTECGYSEQCLVKCVPDLALRQSCKRALRMTDMDEGRIREEVEEIIVPEDGRIVVKLKDGKVYEDIFRSREPVEKQPRSTNCFSKRIRCGCCGNYFQSHPFYTDGRREVQYRCFHCRDNSYINENVLRFRIKDSLGWDEFDCGRCRDNVEEILMDKPCHMVIKTKDGRKTEVEYYAQDRRYSRNGRKDISSRNPWSNRRRSGVQPGTQGFLRTTKSSRAAMRLSLIITRHISREGMIGSLLACIRKCKPKN